MLHEKKSQTLEIDLGRIDNHTRPAKIFVTANPRASRSALDCELHMDTFHKNTIWSENKAYKLDYIPN